MKNTLFVATLILLAAMSRIIPHVPNFTPICAIALFGGAKLKDGITAVLLPLVIMIISDAIIGFHSTMPYVYSSIVIISLIGMIIGNEATFKSTIYAMIASTLIFFLITNFGVWYSLPDRNSQTLSQIYILGLPFIKNSLMGNLFYVSLLFSIHYFVENRTNNLFR